MKKQKRDVMLHPSVTQEIYDLVDQEAEQDGRSKSTVVYRILQKHYADKLKSGKPKNKNMGGSPCAK